MLTYKDGQPKYVVIIGEYINMHEWKPIMCIPFFDLESAEKYKEDMSKHTHPQEIQVVILEQ